MAVIRIKAVLIKWQPGILPEQQNKFGFERQQRKHT